MHIFELTASVLLSMFMVGMCFFLLNGAKSLNSEDNLGYITLCIVFGIVSAAIAIFTVKGFIPFVRGYHPPFWVIIVIWLLCSLPFIDRIEVFGNIILDAVFISIFVTLIILTTTSGFHELMSGSLTVWLIKPWLILSLSFSIITACVIRIFY